MKDRGSKTAKRLLVVLALLVLLIGGVAWVSSDKVMLRRLINQWGRWRKEKPAVYHDYEGYSPGANRSRVEEDFNRYYYYIAPARDEMLNSDPEIYFRQDHEAIAPQTTFDEDQYWRENPLTFDDDIPDNQEATVP